MVCFDIFLVCSSLVLRRRYFLVCVMKVYGCCALSPKTAPVSKKVKIIKEGNVKSKTQRGPHPWPKDAPLMRSGVKYQKTGFSLLCSCHATYSYSLPFSRGIWIKWLQECKHLFHCAHLFMSVDDEAFCRHLSRLRFDMSSLRKIFWEKRNEKRQRISQ